MVSNGPILLHKSSQPTATPPMQVPANDSPHISSVLVVGSRRCGKSSILQVVFKDYLPKRTLYIEPTTRIQKIRTDTAIPLEFWDCPGNTQLQTLPLSQFSTILFVIDIQDSFNYSIPRLVDITSAAYRENPEINVEVFVHKADVLSDDYRLDTYAHIQTRIMDDLQDASLDVESLQLRFHLTSIYDHTIHESFSQVIQRLIEPLPYLEELMNAFCLNSRLSKAFLFDINFRIYVASDSSPVDSATHNLCCDYVKMLSQFIPLYRDGVKSIKSDGGENRPSNSSVRLNPDTTLAYWQVTSNLAVVALLPSETYLTKRGLIEYNLVFFKQGIQEILEVDAAERSQKLKISLNST